MRIVGKMRMDLSDKRNNHCGWPWALKRLGQKGAGILPGRDKNIDVSC